MKERLFVILTILFVVLTIWNVIEVGYIFLGWAGVALGIIAIILLGEFRPSVITVMSDSLFVLTAIFSILVGTLSYPGWYGWASRIRGDYLTSYVNHIEPRTQQRDENHAGHPSVATGTSLLLNR